MKKALSINLFLFILFVIGCSSNVVNNEQVSLKDYLDAKETTFEDISVQMGIANWNVYSQEDEGDQDTPKNRFYELFNDNELITTVNTWYNKLESIKDPVLKRRVLVWHRVLTGAQADMSKEVFKLENILEAKFAGDGSEAADIDDEILKLMKLRNAKAKELGYDNYAQMSLELSGLGEETFNKFAAELLKRTEEPYKNALAELDTEDISYADLRPFVGQFYRNAGPVGIKAEEQMDIMKESLANIGIDFEGLPIRFVEKQIPYGGNSLAVRIPDDNRIVMQPGMPLSVWMHEAGHGLHGTLNQMPFPILKGYEWCMGNHNSAFSEGMAEVCAEITNNKQWLLKYSQVTSDELEQRKQIAKKYLPVYLRLRFLPAIYEIELYRDLNQDPQELYKKIAEKVLLINKHGAPYKLSSSVMYVSYPVYMHNYLMASVIANQVHRALEDKFGDDYLFNKKVANYLTEKLYKDGELLPWRDRVKAATGIEFDVDGFFTYYGM